MIVVELEEDPSIRMVGNVVAESGAPINSVDPARLEISLPVRVTFEAVSDEISLPRWIFEGVTERSESALHGRRTSAATNRGSRQE